MTHSFFHLNSAHCPGKKQVWQKKQKLSSSPTLMTFPLPQMPRRGNQFTIDTHQWAFMVEQLPAWHPDSYTRDQELVTWVASSAVSGPIVFELILVKWLDWVAHVLTCLLNTEIIYNAEMNVFIQIQKCSCLSTEKLACLSHSGNCMPGNDKISVFVTCKYLDVSVKQELLRLSG